MFNLLYWLQGNRYCLWKIDLGDRRLCLGKGYKCLAVICTFIAGVQAQIITISYNQIDLASQIVNALFFAGLFADIGAVSAASGRWYEMMMPDEAHHVYDWFHTSESSTTTIAEEEEEEK
ncbi:hypothetical protein F5887DRAFT_435307 [Amanita rubescens]|nr:hypothetical protein F5887DRAFT_435307 [Amanita rubescens]